MNKQKHFAEMIYEEGERFYGSKSRVRVPCNSHAEAVNKCLEANESGYRGMGIYFPHTTIARTVEWQK